MPRRGLVLVVDDDAAIRALHRLNLEHRGYDVAEAADGASALVAAGERRPDVVLLDVQMPVLDGWSTLEQMRTVDSLRSVPVVMVTALADEVNEERAAALGVAAFVGKPVPIDDLERVVRRVLDGAAGG